MREASYALGKTKRGDDPPRAAAVGARRTSPPAPRSGWAASSATPRSSSILLGATLQLQPLEDVFGPAGVLRGTGSTLTSYVYNNSPAGEGGAFEKAYAAAFVLLLARRAC